MKNITLKIKIYYILILVFAISCSNNQIIPQAEPFENTLISINNDSTNLFKNSFSERIHNEKTDSLNWNEKLKVAKKRMESAFDKLNPNDFSYEFDKKKSRLIVIHKTYQPFSMKVIFENGKWRLDEH